MLGDVLPRLLLAAVLTQAPPPPPPPVQQPDSALRRLVHEYIALYRRDSLERWEGLFLPGFHASFTNSDGSTTSLSLAEFVARQRRGFASNREMSEVLENVRYDRTGRLASVWADFVFRSDAGSRRGRLVLLCIQDRGAWRIQSLLFSYHGEG